MLGEIGLVKLLRSRSGALETQVYHDILAIQRSRTLTVKKAVNIKNI